VWPLIAHFKAVKTDQQRRLASNDAELKKTGSLELKAQNSGIKTKHVLATLVASLMIAPMVASASCEGLVISGDLATAKLVLPSGSVTLLSGAAVASTESLQPVSAGYVKSAVIGGAATCTVDKTSGNCCYIHNYWSGFNSSQLQWGHFYR